MSINTRCPRTTPAEHGVGAADLDTEEALLDSAGPNTVQAAGQALPLRRNLLRARARTLTHVFASNGFIELTVFLVLAVAYNFVRAASDSDSLVAVAHARGIVSAEGALFTHLEVPLNSWMSGIAAIAVPACYFYALMHYVATPVVFFVSRRHGGWRYWRGYWALVLGSAFALVVYLTYPVAPPRLVPGLGIIDIMRQYAAEGWWGSAASAPRGIGDATNQFAAMPSMHFGWALWCAIQMWRFPSRLWRIPAVVYPVVLCVVVLATGNHFLLDVLAGGACMLAAYALVSAIGHWYRADPDGSQSAVPNPRKAATTS